MAATLPPFPGTTGQRDWRTAFDAIKKLLNNGDDTVQVFRIMRALNTGSTEWGYAKLLGTEEGGRIAREQAAVNAVRISRKSDTNSSAEATEVIFSRKYAWSRFSAGSRAMTACCAAIAPPNPPA